MSYDSVCKFIAENFTADITTWLLGEPVELVRLEPSELVSSPIYADTLVALEDRNLSLHIEFQVEPKPDIPFRMLDYAVRAIRRTPEKAVRQVVVYLRRSRSPLVRQTVSERDSTRHEFQVIRIWEEPSSRFRELPGLLPFAVLSETRDRERTLQQVSRQIEDIGDRGQRGDVAASTAILAGLVLDKDLIRNVLREDVMKESVVYQDIVATAEERGRQKEGLSFASRMLKRRFGELPPEIVQKVEGLSLASLEQLGEALFDLSDRAALATWLQEHQ
ncbi:hypothetical protein KR51_00021370 [Rubidibacter lacunae KORDI 51-2]|uniref:DUF4351 domain-containing protein n=1 Tax=Rubidibacter lacunae KORDI 51-2 TaxID=582515 RepID=U5DL08_9CHRO|nr:DUF4351 domain-containing protein [Rubidibacter lacunae]ERN41249.1 hypothetical protein KR51_00021370 [Rubidibacter lacunae KORDI 51-2]